jgi:hypothetical protein
MEGDYDGLVDARNQMLEIKAYLQPGELQRDFAQDPESFATAAHIGIRSLANYRGIAMANGDDDAQINVLWDSLRLEGERFAEPMEWRVQNGGIVLEAAESMPSHRVFEGDIVPAKLLASLFDTERQ